MAKIERPRLENEIAQKEKKKEKKISE